MPKIMPERDDTCIASNTGTGALASCKNFQSTLAIRVQKEHDEVVALNDSKASIFTLRVLCARVRTVLFKSILEVFV